jgi:osmotically-inducible protein OsmY
MKPIRSNEILRDAVLKELERDPEVIAKYISVTAIDGAIALGGHVMTIHEKHVAVRAAQRVSAVRAVADAIEVKEPSLHKRADDEIAEEVAHLRSWGTEIPDSVAAQVRGGRVILHGQVESQFQRTAAVRAVRQLTGVRGVDNLITVESRTEPAAADVERRVHEAIARMVDRHVRSIRVTMNQSTAHLRGQLPSSAALRAVLDAAETVPGVTAVTSDIVVGP